MGEAKRRGTYEQRVERAVAIQEERVSALLTKRGVSHTPMEVKALVASLMAQATIQPGGMPPWPK